MAPIDPATASGWKNYDENHNKYFCDDKETLADKEKCLEEHSYIFLKKQFVKIPYICYNINIKLLGSKT